MYLKQGLISQNVKEASQLYDFKNNFLPLTLVWANRSAFGNALFRFDLSKHNTRASKSMEDCFWLLKKDFYKMNIFPSSL